MSTAAGNYDYVFKIILIGDNGVGKSSFIRRFCEGSFVADMETTIGVDFYISELDLNGKKIKVGEVIYTQCTCIEDPGRLLADYYEYIVCDIN